MSHKVILLKFRTRNSNAHIFLFLFVCSLIADNFCAPNSLPGPFPFDTTVLFPADRNSQFDSAFITRYALKLDYWEGCTPSTRAACGGRIIDFAMQGEDSIYSWISKPDSLATLFSEGICFTPVVGCTTTVSLDLTSYYVLTLRTSMLYVRVMEIGLDTATADLKALSIRIDTLPPALNARDRNFVPISGSTIFHSGRKYRYYNCLGQAVSPVSINDHMQQLLILKLGAWYLRKSVIMR